MPLQSEDYSEASSNLYDQLKWTKETRLLEISTSAFFVKLIFNVIIVLLIIPLRPPPKKKRWILSRRYFLQQQQQQQQPKKIISKKKYFHFDCVIAYQASTWL